MRRLFGVGVDCQDLHRRTYESEENRVPEINLAAPDCACENYRLSRYSPYPVEGTETLARFIVSPMHVHKKTGAVTPAAFSHAFGKGCSMQREFLAVDSELGYAVKSILRKPEWAWQGVLLGSCKEVREITAPDTDKRAICVYDSAEKENHAHCEIGKTQHIEETDRAEITEQLMRIFGNATIVPPSQYRHGTVFALLA